MAAVTPALSIHLPVALDQHHFLLGAWMVVGGGGEEGRARLRMPVADA
jgi:hypothetical protein